MGGILVLGSGAWIDASGTGHNEYRLVELIVAPDEIGPLAELSVYHDVWARCDFRGEPHPAVHAHNAPRLASALRALDQLLGVAAEPGEPTYYGQAEGYGLRARTSSAGGGRTSPMPYSDEGVPWATGRRRGSWSDFGRRNGTGSGTTSSDVSCPVAC